MSENLCPCGSEYQPSLTLPDFLWCQACGAYLVRSETKVHLAAEEDLLEAIPRAIAGYDAIINEARRKIQRLEELYDSL